MEIVVVVVVVLNHRVKRRCRPGQGKNPGLKGLTGRSQRGIIFRRNRDFGD